MTPLGLRISARIAAEGPMRLSDYMAECLLDPEHGYYATREPFGAKGDFTTAPEISQMFGELFGLSLGQHWLDHGAPRPFTLAELGPGRGTLMADALRALRAVPGCLEVAQVHLVEASPRLREVQAALLAGAAPVFHDSADTLPEAPLHLIANEFFDALPIRQFRREEGALWRERQIGLNAVGGLISGWSPAAGFAPLEARLADTAPGDIVEHCPGIAPVAEAVAGRIARHGGAALIVDYGGWHSLGDTFQALAGHAPTDPFKAPGKADLTAHVDFAALAQAARAAGAEASAMTTQGAFLTSLGIAARAATLARGLEGAALASHSAAQRRLTDQFEMGTLFKVLAWHRPGERPPSGTQARPPR